MTEPRATESPDDIINAALDFVVELLSAMDVPADITVPVETAEQITIRIDTDEDAAILIGRKGQTLQAIQYLVNVAFGTRLDRRILVDVGDYRQRHDERLLEDARVAASAIQENGGRHMFDPMPPVDRRVVHQYVSANFPDLQTYSVGEEPNRRLVLEGKDAESLSANQIGRWEGSRREPRNFDPKRGGTYHSRRPR